jgi:hypothetical protein
MVRKPKQLMVEGIEIQRKLKRTIWVTFKLEGIHCYPDAGINPLLKDVSFLQHDHRHQFGFHVEIEVDHNERQIEFILFKRWLMGLYNTGVLDLNSKSCETISEELIDKIKIEYPFKTIKVSVDEDGENGCTIISEIS